MYKPIQDYQFRNVTGVKFSPLSLQPPTRPMNDAQKTQWMWLLWDRTGGWNSDIPDLNGLEATVRELNTLVGIDISKSVQAQLDSKLSKADLGTMAEQNADAVAITGGSISGVSADNLAVTNTDIRSSTIENSTIINAIKIPIGSTTSTSKALGVGHIDYTAVSNIGGSESNLMQTSLQDNTLVNAGDLLELKMWGHFVSDANPKRIRVYFGTSNILDTGALAITDGSWEINGRVLLKAANTEECIINFNTSSNDLATNFNFTRRTEINITTSTAINVKTTAETVNNNIIFQDAFIIKYLNYI